MLCILMQLITEEPWGFCSCMMLLMNHLSIVNSLIALPLAFRFEEISIFYPFCYCFIVNVCCLHFLFLGVGNQHICSCVLLDFCSSCVSRILCFLVWVPSKICLLFDNCFIEVDLWKIFFLI